MQANEITRIMEAAKKNGKVFLRSGRGIWDICDLSGTHRTASDARARRMIDKMMQPLESK